MTHYNSRKKHHEADNREMYKQCKLHCGCSHTHKSKEKHSFTPCSGLTRCYVAREHSSCCCLPSKCDSASLVDHKVLNLLPVQLLCLTVLHSYHDHSQPSISAPLSCRAPRSSPTFWVFAAVTEIVKSVINVANLNPRLHQDPELCPPADADAPGASSSSPLWFRSHGVNHDFFMRRSFALLLMKLEM